MSDETRTTPAAQSPAIEAIGISRSFGGVEALTEAALTASFGEVHALVGENGAGKSTLIKIIGGTVKPEAGSVVIDGEDVTASGPGAARRLGVGTVFQELTLFPWLTVAENLFVGREPRGPCGLDPAAEAPSARGRGSRALRRERHQPALPRGLAPSRATPDGRDHLRLHERTAHPPARRADLGTCRTRGRLAVRACPPPP